MIKTISVVTPCFNEQDGIRECAEAVRKVFQTSLPTYRLEHLFCDNCSTDDTVSILKQMAAECSDVKVILNSRNFGILKSAYNGVMSTSGEAVVLFLPADLQDPPEIIPKLVGHWEAGYEIVYGIRATREEGFVIRSARKIYYRLLSKITSVNYPPDVGDFQLVDRKVLDAMRGVEDAQPFMRLMTFDMGFRSIGVKYTWRKRRHGKSRNTISNLFGQGLNGIVSYSGAPLRLALFLGTALAMLSVLYAFAVLVLTLFGFINSQHGIPTIIIALFFFGGVQLFFLGVLGEYILAILNQVRKRPLVVERERINFP